MSSLFFVSAKYFSRKTAGEREAGQALFRGVVRAFPDANHSGAIHYNNDNIFSCGQEIN